MDVALQCLEQLPYLVEFFLFLHLIFNECIYSKPNCTQKIDDVI